VFNEVNLKINLRPLAKTTSIKRPDRLRDERLFKIF